MYVHTHNSDVLLISIISVVGDCHDHSGASRWHAIVSL